MYQAYNAFNEYFDGYLIKLDVMYYLQIFGISIPNYYLMGIDIR